jgi:Protein of unknown function (DUF742)
MSNEHTDLRLPGRPGETPPLDAAGIARPYAVTGGRTNPRYRVQIEAMVAASHYEARDLSSLSPECQAILGFCRDWRSVAEISAVLRIPLGVARVLVADMAVEGLVRVHQLDHPGGRPDLNLLERVLSGLRKIPSDDQKPQAPEPLLREVLLRAEQEIQGALTVDPDVGLADVTSRAIRAWQLSASEPQADEEP